MSKGIKTKATVKDVKALDKSAVAAERMKQAYIRTKDKAEHGMYAEESSPAEYASDRFSSGVDSVSHEAVHQFDKQGRITKQTLRTQTANGLFFMVKPARKFTKRKWQLLSRSTMPRSGVNLLRLPSIAKSGC